MNNNQIQDRLISTDIKWDISELASLQQVDLGHHLSKMQFVIVVILSFFGVFSTWSFWSFGVAALWLNACIFWLGITTLLAAARGFSQKQTLLWYIPFILLSVSFFLFENPLFKIANLVLFIPLLLLFFNVRKDDPHYWGLHFIGKVIQRLFAIFSPLDIWKLFEGLKKYTGKKIGKIFTGISILAWVLIIVLPLLASVDEDFSHFLRNMIDSISLMNVWKTFLVLVLSTLIGMIIYTRDMHPDNSTDITDHKRYDAFIGTIVIWGVLFFYLVFLYFQADKLFVWGFPNVFGEVAKLVKWGFWQLIVLSFINLVLIRIFFDRKQKVVHSALFIFLVASVGLLVSASFRMMLYVKWYGLSPEKFYASYSVIFCIVLFFVLWLHFFRAHRLDTVKLTSYIFLWMFALVSIMPVDRMIFATNLSLKDVPESRICWNQLRWLSADILTVARNNPEIRTIKSNCDVVSRSKDWYMDITLLPQELDDISENQKIFPFWPNAVADDSFKTAWKKGELQPAWLQWTLTDILVYYRYNFSDYYSTPKE